jgi:WD40 repeat protein
MGFTRGCSRLTAREQYHQEAVMPGVLSAGVLTLAALQVGQQPTRASKVDVEPRRTLRSGDGPVWSLSFSPDGKPLAAGAVGTVKLWEVVTGKVRTTLAVHPDEVKAVAFAPRGDGLAFCVRKDASARLWDLRTRRVRAVFRVHTDWVYSLAFSPDGKVLATGGTDDNLRLWDAATGKEAAAFRVRSAGVYCVAFSPDGKLLASGGDHGTLRLWQVATGKEKAALRGHGKGQFDEVWSVTFGVSG